MADGVTGGAAPPSSARDHAIVRMRLVVCALFVAVAAWLLPGAFDLRHDDDVLAFLPPEHEDVVAFRDVADRFGMLEIVLVGLEAEGDVLTPETIEPNRTLATKISEIPGVRLVLSLPAFPEAIVENNTLVVRELVGESLTTAPAIRERALQNPNAVGNVVSPGGDAAAILAFLNTDDSEDRLANRARILAEIRGATEEHWPWQAYFGGSPFVEHEASQSSRTDIEGLSPIVIGVLAVVSALLLRSGTAAVLNLLITGLGVGLIVGAHGRFGEAFTIVSSTTPVMMVALGGAFGMHVLAGYQRHKGTSTQRASATLRELWRPVLLSGLTTSVAFFALVVMPQVPMQRFGIAAGSGVLVLLVLSLVLLPALLAVLPARLLPTQPNRILPRPWAPPSWALAALAVLGVGLGIRLEADPDTTNLFDEQSEVRRTSAFFDEHFGGSQYLQIAVDADLTRPRVLREVRALAEEVARLDGITEVRSLVEPVALLTEGFGGRKGLPSTYKRARRVVQNLADHPATAQLMRTKADGAVIHIKLAPGGSDAMTATTDAVRNVVGAHPSGVLREGKADDPVVAAARLEHVRWRVEGLAGAELPAERFEELRTGPVGGDKMLAEVERLRQRALGGDELIKPLPDAVVQRADLSKLLTLRGKALETYLSETLPELVAADAEGVSFVAEFLGEWIDEAQRERRLGRLCESVGLPPPPEAPTPSDEGGGEDELGLGLGLPGEADADPADAAPQGNGDGAPGAPPPPPLSEGEKKCLEVIAALKELDDETWSRPDDAQGDVVHETPWTVTLTGQPIIGQAFAQSVTTSLRHSTLVSLGALALVLLLAGHVRALVPATWTLAVTAGVIALLGHPISIASSMVACIALGAGVDFAIHLEVRARAATGDDPGREAADALGSVVLMAGLQLGLAFCVLLASTMPPLREFGLGLAIGLLLAATGAVWLTPRLFPRRPARRSDAAARGHAGGDADARPASTPDAAASGPASERSAHEDRGEDEA